MLILASASPQRRRLLRSLRVPFKIIPSRVSEATSESNPRKLVAELAMRKAKAVAAKHPRALVLGADTIVVHQGKILTKPRDRADSRRLLDILNGHCHRVYTGVALIDHLSGKFWKEVTVTKVTARRFPPEEIEKLVGRHMDKAGGYAVQDRNDP
ncbi:MAG: Maf family nucleotide pyrophosphatase, partial [Elusimicrobiota bacterium]